MSEKFTVVKKENGFQIRGVDGYQLLMSNRFDAEKHCEYLNQQEDIKNELLEDTIKYYTCLKKIKFLVDVIHQECGELNVLEKCIQIKNLLKEVL